MRILLGWMNQLFDAAALPYDLVTLGPNGCDVAYPDARTRASDLKLPGDWHPDVVVWLYPEFFPPPPDLEEAFGCPIVAVFGDWNLAFNADLANLPRFAYAFADRLGTAILNRFGHTNVEEWLAYSVFAHLHAHMPAEPRVHDVTFVGNLNAAVQGERNRWLKRLALMSSRFDVQIASGVFGADYTRFMNRSKIVFNRTIRNELNMRCFEALATKALLFVEEENLEAPDYLEDRVHCVYYNEDNFEELIAYYVTHDAEREAVAAAGHERWRELTYEVTFPRLLDRITDLWRTGRLAHGRRTAPAMAQYFFNTRLADALPVGYEILLASQVLGRDKIVTNRMMAMLCSDTAVRHTTDRHFWAKKGEGAALQVLADAPQDPVARFHLAQCLDVAGRCEEALLVRERLCGDLADDALLPLLCESGNVHAFFDPLRTAWERVTFLSMGDRQQLEKGRRDLLLGACHAILGESLHQKDPAAAVAHYARALECWPSQPKALFDMATLLWGLGEPAKAIAAQGAGVEECPFDMGQGKRLVEWLMAADRHQEASQRLNELLLIVKATPHLSEAADGLRQLQGELLERQRQALL